MKIEWIAAKDRLPEHDGKYFTVCVEPEDREDWIPDLAYFSKGDWETEHDRVGEEYEVVYWAHMDLPDFTDEHTKTNNKDNA